jgi:hypothetical protein
MVYNSGLKTKIQAANGYCTTHMLDFGLGTEGVKMTPHLGSCILSK